MDIAIEQGEGGEIELESLLKSIDPDCCSRKHLKSLKAVVEQAGCNGTQNQCSSISLN